MKGYIINILFQMARYTSGQTRRNPAIRHREYISPVTGPTNG